MKILCIIDSLGAGGAQRQLVELAKGFKLEGHDVSFITYHDINFFKPELDKHSIRTETVVEPNYIKRLFKVRMAIRRKQPDAVLSFLEAANFMAVFAGFPYRKWKLVVGERSANPAIVTDRKLRFYRKAHFFADFIVGNSRKNIELVKSIIPSISQDKLKVIYNSVEIPEHIHFPDSESEMVNIVVAASYRAVKNLDGLIDAFQLLSDEYKARLKIRWFGDIAIDQGYFNTQNDRINKLGLAQNLVLNDKTTEIRRYYATADFVGLFSHYEGFPNTICEGMAMGKPVIVSRVSDVPLFIKEDENGFLCESRQPESIVDALVKAIDSSPSRRKTMGRENYDIAMQQFNSANNTRKYLALFA